MAELTDAATLAVLREMGWPDDREFSAHVEPDSYQLTPPGAYWDAAREIAEAVMRVITEAGEAPAKQEKPRAHAWRGRGATNGPHRYTGKGPGLPKAHKPAQEGDR